MFQFLFMSLYDVRSAIRFRPMRKCDFPCCSSQGTARFLNGVFAEITCPVIMGSFGLYSGLQLPLQLLKSEL